MLPCAAAEPAPQQCQALLDERDIAFDFSLQDFPLQPAAIADDARVGAITIRSFPIFDPDDPKEDYRLFRAANRFHINTRESTVRQQLLIEPGDTYKPRLLAESARLLRNQGYLYDAKVFPYRICDGRVDIMVVTRDVWTLTPGIAFSRSGGSNTNTFVLRENNLLGYGKSIFLQRKESVDRNGWEFGYSDGNLFGSRLTLDLEYADNEDGERRHFAIARPFYALDTRWAMNLNATQDNRVDKLYDRGESLAQFRIDESRYQLSGGLSAGRQKDRTQRWFVGLDWWQQEFSEDPGGASPTPFPVARTINTLWFGPQVIEDQFVTLHNFNQIYRTEDINLGKRWQWRLGWADSAWGSDRDRLVYDYRYTNSWLLDDDHLLNYQLALTGFWDEDNNRSEDVLIRNRWRYNRIDTHRTATFASLDLDYARNLPAHKQLLLGGEENLRGYPLRYQAGDRRALLTLEKRIYFDRHWLRLFRVGAAAFVDVGRAWFPGAPNSGATGVLSNVGMGLRIVSSRAETSRVLHIDIAFPLEREDDVDKIQFIVTGKRAF